MIRFLGFYPGEYLGEVFLQEVHICVVLGFQPFLKGVHQARVLVVHSLLEFVNERYF